MVPDTVSVPLAQFGPKQEVESWSGVFGERSSVIGRLLSSVSAAQDSDNHHLRRQHRAAGERHPQGDALPALRDQDHHVRVAAGEADPGVS